MSIGIPIGQWTNPDFKGISAPANSKTVCARQFHSQEPANHFSEFLGSLGMINKVVKEETDGSLWTVFWTEGGFA